MKARRLEAWALTAAILAWPAIGDAQEPGFRPIWFAPVLELKGLEDIDKRLARPIAWDERVKARRGRGDNVIEVEAANCATLQRLAEERTLPESDNDRFIFLYQKTNCDVVQMLKTARPSRESYVRDFVLNPAALNLLPPAVDLAPDCAAMCRWVGAGERRQSWRDVHDAAAWNEGAGAAGVQVRHDEEMSIDRNGARTTFEILARADFNRDDLEDVVVRVTRGPTLGLPVAAELFLLTRDTAGGMLRLVNPRRYLCPDTRCGE